MCAVKKSSKFEAEMFTGGDIPWQPPAVQVLIHNNLAIWFHSNVCDIWENHLWSFCVG